MRAKRNEDEEVMDRMTEVFRSVGYEGATLSLLSEATGLQRASLYHRFPKGKQGMAEAVLLRVGDAFVRQILAPLTGPGTPQARLEKMARALDVFYARGQASCLLDTLSLGGDRAVFQSQIKALFSGWIESFAGLVVEATGCSKGKARKRAEDAVAGIQGALVLARATGNTQPFRRILRTLPASLLAQDR